MITFASSSPVPVETTVADISAAVRQYAGLVYATARRMVGDDSVAEDVAQSAFMALARKFHQIDPRILPGWLVNTTRLAARQILRAKMTRQKHEARAAGERREVQDGADEPAVDELLPLLDDALAKLGEVDRAAVVLRFFQGQSFAQVARCIESTEDTARKRVARAVEKLREILMQQGLVPSAGGIMLALASQQSREAPAAFVASAMKAVRDHSASRGLTINLAARSLVNLKATMLLAAVGLGVTIAVHRGNAGDGSGVAAAAPAIAPTTAPVASKRPTDFIARLANGTTVELFGVNDNPDEGKPGWRVDGEALAVPFDGVTNEMPASTGFRSIEIGLRFTGKDELRRPWNALNTKWSSSGGTLGLAGRSKNGKAVPNEFVLLGLVPEDADRTNVTIRLALKAAQVVVKLAGNAAGLKNGADMPGLGHFELSNPREVDGSAVVTVNIPKLPEGWQVVVRAVPRGRGYIAATDGASAIGGTGGEARDITYTAKLADVAEFRAEVRDYTTSVEFRNLSLKAGMHTDFQIVTHDAVPPPAPAGGTAPGDQGL